MIRPLLHDMTRSELHAVMTGGFATIAGSVLAAYILMGVSTHTLIFLLFLVGTTRCEGTSIVSKISYSAGLSMLRYRNPYSLP